MNIIEGMRPLLGVLQLFGLSVTQFPTFKYISLHRVIKCYSLLFIAIRFIVFCYISVEYQILYLDDDKLHSIIDMVILISAQTLQVSILFEAFVKARQERTFLENFLEIDDIFMNHFNVDLKISKQRNSAIKLLVIWLCIITVDSALSLVSNYNTTYFPFEIITVLSFFTATFTYFQIVTWTDLIRYRLCIVKRLINELIYDHNEKIKNHESEKLKNPHNAHETKESEQTTCVNRIETANESNNVDDTLVFDQFCILCDLYNRLWTQTNVLNERFRFSMVLNIGNDFAYLVALLYFIFMCLRNFTTCEFFVPDFSRCILNLFHLSMLNRAGQNMADEALQIAHAIHRNKIIRSSPKLNTFVSVNSFNYLQF